MDGQGLLLLIGIKVLIMVTSLQNIVISGAQGLLMLMGSKFLIENYQAENNCSFYLNVLQPSHIYQKF